MPDDWEPTPQQRVTAETLGFNPGMFEVCLAGFRLWANGGPAGKVRPKRIDWPETFNNWITGDSAEPRKMEFFRRTALVRAGKAITDTPISTAMGGQTAAQGLRNAFHDTDAIAAAFAETADERHQPPHHDGPTLELAADTDHAIGDGPIDRGTMPEHCPSICPSIAPALPEQCSNMPNRTGPDRIQTTPRSLRSLRGALAAGADPVNGHGAEDAIDQLHTKVAASGKASQPSRRKQRPGIEHAPLPMGRVAHRNGYDLSHRAT